MYVCIYVCVLVRVCCSVCAWLYDSCGADTASEHQSSDVMRIDKNKREGEERREQNRTEKSRIDENVRKEEKR
jgi:hypothetical protein